MTSRNPVKIALFGTSVTPCMSAMCGPTGNKRRDGLASIQGYMSAKMPSSFEIIEDSLPAGMTNFDDPNMKYPYQFNGQVALLQFVDEIPDI